MLNLRLNFTLISLVIILFACQNPGETAAIPDNVLFRDEFLPGQSGSWLLEADELGSTSLINEQLVVSVNTPNTMQFSTLAEETFSDFVLEADVRQLSGAPDSSYGVLFRMQDSERFYRFEITGDGRYIVERRNQDGSWTRLTSDWLSSAAINPGLNVVNQVKIIANGPEITVFVNDILLQQTFDNAYASGTVGFDAGSFNDNNLQVAFDNLVLFGAESE